MSTRYTTRECAEMLHAALEQCGPSTRPSLIAQTGLGGHAVGRGLKYLKDAKVIINTAQPGTDARFALTGQVLQPPSEKELARGSAPLPKMSFDALLSAWPIRPARKENAAKLQGRQI